MMQLFIILFLSAGVLLIAYAIYVETTKCKICSMKYGHHKINCPKNERYLGPVNRNIIKNHEAWLTCNECTMCFDVRQHGYICPYCHNDNK